MLISLLSFGLSVNASDDFFDDLFIFPVTQDSSPNEIATGVIIDLVSVCRTIAAGQYNFNITDASINVLAIPALFTCFAYILIVFVVSVNRCAQVTESTVPQQIFCFRSFQLQQIEVTPQKKILTSSERPAVLWDFVLTEEPVQIDKIEIETTDNSYRDIVPNVELYENVVIDPEKLVWRPMKSLFSYENWY